jgi:uncharacterized membrane protein YfcA
VDIYLPIAASSASVPLLIGLGGLVGFLSGMFGVGGGFLLTPLLMMIGIPATVAAASDANQIVAASTSGCYAHFREGNVDFKMGTVMLVSGLAGSGLGVQIIKLLRAMGEANFAITLVYVVMLGTIGSYMFAESVVALRGRRPKAGRPAPRPSTYRRVMQGLPLQVHFPRSKVTLSAFVPASLGFLVGLLAAIMGVGGGFIMVPVMVYLLRMPMHVVVGTSLFQVLFTSMNVTLLQAYVNHTVDFILALILLLGSAVGAQIGARAGRRLNADQLKILMSVVVLVVMLKMLLGLLQAPDVLLTYKGGH